MDTAIPCSHQKQPLPGGDAASFVLSRFPHPDTAAAEGAAFVDAATGRSLSFTALRRGALSLASGLRVGLGLRRGDAVLIILPSPAASNDQEDSSLLLLPQIVLGVLAAGGVVVAADPDATPAQISGSGAVIVVAPPDLAGKVAGSSGVPLLLTGRSLDPRTLSAEELIEGGDPTALPVVDEEQPRPSDSDVAFVAYSSSAGSKKVAMTHADLIAAVIGLLPGDEEGRRRVCLASLPICSSAQSLPLLALGLPAAGVTTVLTPQLCHDPRAARDAVAAHGATDVVATPDVAAVLAAPIPLDDRLSSLRRVLVVAPVPLPAEARLHFRRRLPWVDLTQQAMPASPSASASQENLQMPPPPVLSQTDAALKQ